MKKIQNKSCNIFFEDSYEVYKIQIHLIENEMPWKLFGLKTIGRKLIGQK
jgi:hypothetical protein